MKRQAANLMVTHTPDGSHYGTLSGHPVSKDKALDLFTRPNDDGLFPGFTQTWSNTAPRQKRKPRPCAR